MFKELHERYVLQLSNQAYKILQNEDFTKDLIQDVFLTLFIKKNDLDRNLNVGAYLTIAVKNRSLNMLRDIKLKQLHHNYVRDHLQATSISSGSEQSELRMQLNNSLAELSGKPKDVFFLRHHENKTYKEISNQLNISAKTVEKHISKAVRLLKEKLRDDWEV